MFTIDLKRNKGTPAYDSNLANAGKLMEDFIVSGSYKYLKELSFEKAAIHKRIYDHLISHESKRHEIGSNLVAKFIPKKIYKYNYVGLNEYLYDYGLLQKLSKLTSSDINKSQHLLELFSPYRLNPEFYIKPTLNKIGREFVETFKSSDFPLTMDMDDLVRIKKENMTSLSIAQAGYEFLKKQMGKCHYLMADKKLTHKYGSVSRVQKPLSYDITKLSDDRAIKSLIEFGKPKVDQLMYYATRGFISKSEIESFRELIDIKLSFVILDLDAEARMMNSTPRRY